MKIGLIIDIYKILKYMWNCGTVEPLFIDISPVLLLMTFFQTGGAGEFRKKLKFEIFNFGLLIS